MSSESSTARGLAILGLSSMAWGHSRLGRDALSANAFPNLDMIGHFRA